jgi:hypothetical protein
MIYHAVPAVRCACPAKTFRKVKQALAYARKAANAFQVAYAVWRVQGGRIRLLKRFPPGAIRRRV